MASNNSSSTMEEEVLTFTKAQQDQRRLRPQPDQALKCPRCDSTNTKFCYYNNYSLSQPRYFCKGCRRYWTQGGTLRNVPVGGGCRKNKRSSSSSSKRSILSQDHQLAVNLITSSTNSNPLVSGAFPPLTSTYDSNDLTLAFARLHNKQPSMQLGLHENHDSTNSIQLGHSDFLANSNTTTTTSPFVDALRSGYLGTQQIGFHHNFNYGFGNEDQVEGGAEVVVLPYDHQMMSGGAANTTTATVTTTTKQELCKQGRNINNGENTVRGFWNFPWHIGGGHQGSIGVGVGVDSGRDCWNGIGSSWHGLINNPLM